MLVNCRHLKFYVSKGLRFRAYECGFHRRVGCLEGLQIRLSAVLLAVTDYFVSFEGYFVENLLRC